MISIFQRVIILAIILEFISSNIVAYASVDKIEGLLYVVRKIEDAPLGHAIEKKYALYELYFENRSDKAFSIPGYTVDFGISYVAFAEINSLFKSKSQKKSTFLNLAAGAASLAFGGVVKTAASTALRVNSFRSKASSFDDNGIFLTANKTYIIYPGDNLSLFFFVNKEFADAPSVIRFICRDEDSVTNNVVINNHLELWTNSTMQSANAGKEETKEDEKSKNVIAVPEVDVFK